MVSFRDNIKKLDVAICMIHTTCAEQRVTFSLLLYVEAGITFRSFFLVLSQNRIVKEQELDGSPILCVVG